MKISFKKYFNEAEKRGLAPYTISLSESTETSVSIFNDDIESQQIGTAIDIGANGLFEGKQGSFSTDAIDNKTPSLLAENVLQSAKYGKEQTADNFYKGGKRYKKALVSFDDFKESSLKELREAGLSLSKKIREKDERITKVEIGLTQVVVNKRKENSLGLKCSFNAKLYQGYFSIVAEDSSKEPRSSSWGFESFHSLEDLMKEADKVIDKTIHGAVDFFKSKPAKSKTYKAILSPGCVSSLLDFLLSQLNAKSVHKHLSVFENKVNEKIMASCLTLKHTPHITARGSSSYDSDGYPTSEFTIVSHGVLKDYFYSLETANEEKRESNGCASGNGNGSYYVVTLTPGKSSLDDLFAKMKNGIYITSVSGLNSGIDAQTLNFSLPCDGYIIKDGKKEKAVSMMVCAGNLQELFLNAVSLGNDVDNDGSIFTPSILFKKLVISGE